MLIENFEVSIEKCFKQFNEVYDGSNLTLNSKDFVSKKIFLKEYVSKVKELFILEKHAKCKIFRKIHRVILCLNYLICGYLKKSSSYKNYENEVLITSFKTLVNKIHDIIINVLKDKKIGSVELIYNKLITRMDIFEDFDRVDLLKMLRECCRGEFVYTVNKLYRKSKKKSMRYSTSNYIRSNRTSLKTRKRNNFLDLDSMELGYTSFNITLSIGENDGILPDQSEFYDASIDILRNYLQINKFLLSNIILISSK
jgi:hypothetical protein